MSTTLIVNAFGGPGSGKSTTCAGVFAWLKNQGVNCEMALEVAKDLVWSKSLHDLSNQRHVYGLQHHRIWKLLDQVEVVVTDGPLLHSLIYADPRDEDLIRMVRSDHSSMNNLNVFLQRVKPFNPKGRVHDLEQSKELDARILNMLNDYGEEIVVLPGEWDSISKIGEIVVNRLGKR